MIWIKGIILGASLFAVGVFVFFVAFLRKTGPLFAPPGHAYSIDIRTIASMTTQNSWFWVAGVACLAIGLAVAASWPGKFFPGFWILLGLADLVPATVLGIFLVPATVLGIFLVMVQKLHQIAGR
jgi:hypothetical protein